MNKTKIDWCDYSWNPIKGICKNNCWYCYARRFYKRFKWNPEPRLDEKELNILFKKRLPKGSKIFVCSTHELFGNWIKTEWIIRILRVIDKFPQYIFIILTKNPRNIKGFWIPKNVWLGVSIESPEYYYRLLDLYHLIIHQKIFPTVKFVSFEPLLEDVLNWEKIRDLGYDASEIVEILKRMDWIIVGGLTGVKKLNCQTNPEMKEWVSKIYDFCRTNKIPIFIKDNVKYPFKSHTIKEFPTFEKLGD